MRSALSPLAALATWLLTAAAPALAAGAAPAGGSADALVAWSGDAAVGIGLSARGERDGTGEAVRLSARSARHGGAALYIEVARERGERGGIAALEDVEYASERHLGAGLLMPLGRDRPMPANARLFLRAALHLSEDRIVDPLVVGERSATADVESRTIALALVATGELGDRPLGWFGSLGLANVDERVDVDVDGPGDVGRTLAGEDDSGVVPTAGIGLAYGRGGWSAHVALEQAGEPGLAAGVRIGF